MVRLTALAIATLLAAACTPMRWVHPQYGLAGAQEDYDDCSRKTRQEALRTSVLFSHWDYPRSYRGRDGKIYYDPFPRYRDPTFDEWTLRDYCMRAKGYRLVPVPEGN